MSTGNRRRWSLTLARWHRWAGIIAALFTLILAATGIALQHAPAMGLDRVSVGSPAVARWLGLRGDPVQAWRVGGDWLLASGDGVWLDDRRIAELEAPLTGAATTRLGLALAVGGDLLLLDREGRRLERLRAGTGLPGPIERLGHAPGGDLLLGGTGKTWKAGPDWLHFESVEDIEPTWTRPADQAPPALIEVVRREELARRVTWERLLLEIHSGRVLGNAGVIVMDAAAIALLLLASTGLYLWWHRR